MRVIQQRLSDSQATVADLRRDVETVRNEAARVDVAKEAAVKELTDVKRKLEILEVCASNLVSQ